MDEFTLIEKLKKYQPCLWTNSNIGNAAEELAKCPVTEADMQQAEQRWLRFAPLLRSLFPETEKNQGIIESELVEISKMKAGIEKTYNTGFGGRLFLKCDNTLPVAGSIKARGGIYEVLKHAEELALKHGLLRETDNYEVLAEPRFRQFYSNYKLAVGSTGNLGMSIGIMGAALGFQVTVHMSADAKAWKKQLLRSRGVNVIEYASDYSKAVEEGRKESKADGSSYFVDDENSVDLFLGYSVAAYRLRRQLEELHIAVDAGHPLYVYLPCGVGGAPGGICFGLKQIFGDNVHCYFVEPTHAPCMLLGLLTGKNEKISVQDIGLDNITEADGLAVGRPSGFVGRTVGRLISGVYTVSDSELYKLLALLKDLEGIRIEPSAAPGMLGPVYLQSLTGPSPTHIAWATGGLFVPEALMQGFYDKGRELLKDTPISWS